MPRIIRKITVGPDYLKGMSFAVDQKVMSGRQGDWKIREITKNKVTGDVCIFVQDMKDNEVFLWKTFPESIAISIEYSLDF